MSSPNAAPSGSPPVTASPPAASTQPPTSSSTPPSLDQTPPPAETPPPPPPAPISTSPPAPPPADSALPPTTSPPPPSPPPPAATGSSPPPSQSPPPPNQSSSPPASSPASATQSPPPPDLSSTPPSAVASPPTPNSGSVLSPPPPPTSTSTPTTPSTSSPTLSPPPPSTSASTPTTPPTPNTSSSSISTSTLASILAAGIVAAVVLLILVYCFCKKKKKRVMYYSGDYHHGSPGALPAHYQAGSYYNPNTKQQGWLSPQSSQSTEVLLNIPRQHDVSLSPANSGGAQGMGNSKSWFTYGELATATNGFSKVNLLGEGGFGCVFKGVLANGQVVAVKQLKTGASQGEKEFQAEVEIISRVHHRHLVSLVGYCIFDSQRLLVYDYVPNNTLEYHLHKRKGGPVMDWATRMKVASGAARGLAYLHEDCHPRIIHRDIKSANILLDNSYEAQVSDFGLAKLTLDNNTHVTTRVMGTFGYLAPEYASSGKLTEKSDVFSFGVVLLELLTGRKSVDIS